MGVEKEMTSGRNIGRRSFLKWAGAVGAGTLGSSLLVACSSDEQKAAEEELKLGNTNGAAISDGLPYGADKIVPTICGCGDVCGCLHTGQCYVKNDKIVFYEGCDKGFNKGALCARGIAAMQIINSPDRIKYPMRRTNEKGTKGEFERISWDEAIDIISDKMAQIITEDGPECIVGVGTHAGNHMCFSVMMRYAMLFNTDAGEFAGGCFNDEKIGPSITLGDWYHCHEADPYNSKLIIMWGENDVLAKPQEWADSYGKAQMEHGATIVSIEPRFSETSEKADIYIPVRPGTDAYVALAMANVIINENLQDDEFIKKYTKGYEEFKELALKYTPELVEKIAWAPADRVRKVARLYATSKPALLAVGRGGNQTGGANSNSGWMMSRAITCLIGLCGQAGVAGSGFTQEASGQIMNSQWFHWPLVAAQAAPALGAKPLVKRNFPNTGTWGASESVYNPDHPYHCRMMITNSNPGSAAGDQTHEHELLSKLEFMVIVNRNIHWTASQFADILLPCSTFAEQYCYREDWEELCITEPAIPAMFESKSDGEIYRLISLAAAKKLGVEATEEEIWPYKTDLDLINCIAANQFTQAEYQKRIDEGREGYEQFIGLDAEKAVKMDGGLIRNPFYAGVEGFVPYKAKDYEALAPKGIDPEEIFFPTYSGHGDDMEARGSEGKLLFKADWLPELDKAFPALPVPCEPCDSWYAEGNPIESGNWEESDAVKAGFNLVAVGKGHKFWQFLSFNQNYDGGPVSSWHREAFVQAAEPCVEVNPADLERLGLVDGDRVNLVSQYGSMDNIRALANPCVQPSTIIPPYHWGNIQNRIYPYSMSLMNMDPAKRHKIIPQMVGPWGNVASVTTAGGQNVQSAVLCKLVKA